MFFPLSQDKPQAGLWGCSSLCLLNSRYQSEQPGSGPCGLGTKVRSQIQTHPPPRASPPMWPPSLCPLPTQLHIPSKVPALAEPGMAYQVVLMALLGWHSSLCQPSISSVDMNVSYCTFATAIQTSVSPEGSWDCSRHHSSCIQFLFCCVCSFYSL